MGEEVVVAWPRRRLVGGVWRGDSTVFTKETKIHENQGCGLNQQHLFHPGYLHGVRQINQDTGKMTVKCRSQV